MIDPPTLHVNVGLKTHDYNTLFASNLFLFRVCIIIDLIMEAGGSQDALSKDLFISQEQMLDKHCVR